MNEDIEQGVRDIVSKSNILYKVVISSGRRLPKNIKKEIEDIIKQINRLRSRLEEFQMKVDGRI